MASLASAQIESMVSTESWSTLGVVPMQLLARLLNLRGARKCISFLKLA
jgi:hypothetical protein